MKLKIRKSNVKRKKQGFRARMRSADGRKTLNRRRKRGRKNLCA